MARWHNNSQRVLLYSCGRLVPWDWTLLRCWVWCSLKKRSSSGHRSSASPELTFLCWNKLFITVLQHSAAALTVGSCLKMTHLRYQIIFPYLAVSSQSMVKWVELQERLEARPGNLLLSDSVIIVKSYKVNWIWILSFFLEYFGLTETATSICNDHKVCLILSYIDCTTELFSSSVLSVWHRLQNIETEGDVRVYKGAMRNPF